MAELFRDFEILKWTIKAFTMLTMQKLIIKEANSILDVFIAMMEKVGIRDDVGNEL